MVLFPADAATFDNQGLGSIVDAVSCNVHEVLNGEYELEMQYPITGLQYNNLQNRRIIYSKHDPYSDPQPFRIYRITRPMNGIISIYARHVSYDLAGIPVGVFDANNAQSAMQGMKNNSLVANPFLLKQPCRPSQTSVANIRSRAGIYWAGRKDPFWMFTAGNTNGMNGRFTCNRAEDWITGFGLPTGKT